VLVTGNVRALPTTRGARIGGVTQNDEVIFLAATPDGNWFKVQLGERYASSSQINSDDGTGWVNGSLLSEPEGDLPIEQPEEPVQEDATPTAAP
jgi:hypothetical protein